jgi:hypothetical protein
MARVMAKSSPPPESFLDALPKELSQALFAEALTIALAAGQALFSAGAKGDGCYRVEKDCLRQASPSQEAASGYSRCLARAQ